MSSDVDPTLLRRLRESDGPLVQYAVRELGLAIIGRSRWATRCPGCGEVVDKAKWESHRCPRRP